MYTPTHYQETRLGVLHALIDAHPLGAWVCLGDTGLVVDHIPFLLEAERGEFGTLVGHVARANPAWQSLAADAESVVIFRGPDAYISPSWCPSKREHGKIVPTWNYAAVHAFGIARAIEDRAWLRSLVETLTARHESARAEPWRVAGAPADYIARRLDAIVGIEIPMRRIEGKWKVSQKDSEEDKRGIAAALEAEKGSRDTEAMAGMIKNAAGFVSC